MKNKTYLRMLFSHPMDKSDQADLKAWHESIAKDSETMSESEFKANLKQYTDLMLIRKLNKMDGELVKVKMNMLFFVVLAVIGIVVSLFT